MHKHLFLVVLSLLDCLCSPDVPVTFCYDNTRLGIDSLIALPNRHEPWQTTTSRRLLNCMGQCRANPHCFTAIYNTSSLNCSFYRKTSAELGVVSVKHDSDAPAVIISPIDDPANYSATFCNGKCGTTPCKKDCGYGTTSNSEFICIADHSSCNDSQYNQFKFLFFGPIESGNASSFTAKTVTFDKKFASSTIRLSWRGDLRTPGNGCTDCCVKYSLLIDNQPCTNPAPIESMLYKGAPANNGHRSDGIEGLCDGISAGTHTVSLVSGPCSSDYTPGNGYVGRGSNSWLFVQEIDTTDKPGSCPGLVSYNIKQYITTDYINGSSTYQFGPALNFSKKENSSALRVTFHGSFQTFVNPDLTITGSLGFRCAAWSYRFNGVECSVPGKANMLEDQREINYRLGSERRYHLWDAICYNIPSGQVTITLHGGCCPGYSICPSEIGWPSSAGNGVTRFIVEEIHLTTKFSAGMVTADGREIITRLPSFNFMHRSTTSYITSSVGTFWAFQYTKQSSNSALRLIFNGNGRQWRSSTSNCCLWAFLINNSECLNPGSINAIMSDDVLAVNHPKLFTIDGICLGIPSGTVAISLSTKQCPGLSTGGNCKTGWVSTSNTYVMEISL